MARTCNVAQALSAAESSAMSPLARIALVEDDLDLLQSTEEFLTAAGYSVWGVSSAEAFYRRFIIDPIDVVILDIGLPGEDGLSVAALLQANPSIAVIILSARDAVEDRLAGLRAGADRYLVKPVSLRELAANIDAVSKRMRLPHGKPLLDLPRQPTRPAPTTHAPNAMAAEPSGDPWCISIQDWILHAPNGSAIKLTAREFALLHKLIAVQGQAVPKKDLADEIFGHRITNGSERLNVLVARLRRKAINTIALELPIRTAHQIGYAFTAPAEFATQ